MKLTEKEILSTFNTLFDEHYSKCGLSEMAYSTQIDISCLDEYEGEDLEKAESLFNSLGEMENVQEVSTTGGEAYFIIHVKESDVYVKVHGYWNSYENFSEYEDATFSLVKPKQVTVTEYS